MAQQQLIELINELVKQPHESEWVEFNILGAIGHKRKDEVSTENK